MAFYGFQQGLEMRSGIRTIVRYMKYAALRVVYYIYTVGVM